MNAQTLAAPSPPVDGDWLEALLAADASEHRGDYLSDGGFTARVMRGLPAPDVLPAWRQPAVVGLWLIAGVLLAITLPGTAHDVAREVFKLFAARPFSLSTIAFVLVAIGAATWTGAAFALRRD